MRSVCSALIKAIEQGDLEEVIAALDSGCNIEEADVHEFPGLPLRIACFNGHYDIVAELLERGASINAPNHEGPDAPIRLAVRGKQGEVIKLLLEHGAEVPPGLDLSQFQPKAEKPELTIEFSQELVEIQMPAEFNPVLDGPQLEELTLPPVELEPILGLTPPKSEPEPTELEPLKLEPLPDLPPLEFN